MHVVEGAGIALDSGTQHVGGLLVDDELLVVDGAVRVGARLVLLVSGGLVRELLLRVLSEFVRWLNRVELIRAARSPLFINKC